MQYVFWIGFAVWGILAAESAFFNLDKFTGSENEFTLALEGFKVRLLRGVVSAIMAFCCLYAAMNWGK